MSDSTVRLALDSQFSLVYSPLDEGPSLSFPCDEQGQVPLDSLSERSRDNYLLARALVGRNYHRPKVTRNLNGTG